MINAVLGKHRIQSKDKSINVFVIVERGFCGMGLVLLFPKGQGQY